MKIAANFPKFVARQQQLTIPISREGTVRAILFLKVSVEFHTALQSLSEMAGTTRRQLTAQKGVRTQV